MINDSGGRLDLAAFLRLFEIRAPQMMWLLGAGASCAARIPSAGEMIWDFKRKLFCSEQRVPPTAVSEIDDHAVRRRIQNHLDGQGRHPCSGAEEEYSHYFEAAYPSSRDRRAYIEEMVKAAAPSFGHHCMALLMKEKLLPAVWTTNFDSLVEDAAAAAFGSIGQLLIADLAEPEKAARGLSESKWPLIVKLHGDFRSDRLMNTEEELRAQDVDMRRNLVEACRRFGLAVAGYSGRDASVMDALEEALADGHGYPKGLYWFIRRDSAPYARVTALIERARSAGVEAALVNLESFDELLADVTRYLPRTSALLDVNPKLARRRRSAAPPIPKGRKLPIVRIAALPVLSAPTSCRVAECTIGGAKEVREAVKAAGVNLDAHRCRAGVIAFGRDADLKKALDPYGPVSLDTYALSPTRMRSDSQQMALMLDALSRALSRQPGLFVAKRGTERILVADPKVHSVVSFNSKPGAMSELSGTVGPLHISWREGCALRLDGKLDRLWILLEPRILLPKDLDEKVGQEAAQGARHFARERRAARHNDAVNSILNGWIGLIVGDQEAVRIRAFDITDGADAEFEISRVSAFSGRGR